MGNPSSPAPPPMFERADWHLFRTIDGVCQFAGCGIDDLAWVVLKELVDNACDAAGTCSSVVDGRSIVVSDSGPGIDGSDEELAALFSPGRVLRSSKLLRKPTRGAMGNGLRVVVGAVMASGGTIVVWTRGRELTLQPQQEDGSSKILSRESWPSTGTTIVVYLGESLQGARMSKARRGLASLLCMSKTTEPIYKGKTSPWWYASDSFFELVKAAPREQTVRELVAEFEGLSGAAAGHVAADFKGRKATSLDMAEAERLLVSARGQAREVKPHRFEPVGEAFTGAGYAIDRGTMRVSAARGATPAMVPYVVEAWATVAERPVFDMYINRSPVIAAKHAWQEKTVQTIASCGMRVEIKAGRKPMRITVNVTAPYLPRTDNGKSPDLSRLTGVIALCAEKATNKAKRGAGGDAQASQRSVIIDELPAAIVKASDSGRYRFSLRQLFYAVRPALIEATGKEPNYNHFCKTIARHEDDNGEQIAGMYRDPRGIIYHPHLRQEVPLGTLAVEKYKRPEWTFGAVLYIEKEGYVAALREDGWPERNDCAIMTGKGFASGAARDLIDLLGREDRELVFFCVHDADGPGTMIYQALQEATVARRKRRVKIINLGLEPDEGRAMGLQVEPVTRKGRVPVAKYVPPADAEWLQKNRIELNAMSTGQFLEWLDRKIAPYLRGKVVPPAAHLQDSLAAAVRGSLLTRLSEEAILQARVEERAEKALESMGPTLASLTPHLSGHVQASLGVEPSGSWSDAIDELGARVASDDASTIADVRRAPVVPDRSPPPPEVEPDDVEAGPVDDTDDDTDEPEEDDTDEETDE